MYHEIEFFLYNDIEFLQIDIYLNNCLNVIILTFAKRYLPIRLSPFNKTLIKLVFINKIFY